MNHLLNLSKSKYRLSYDQINKKSLDQIYFLINKIIKKKLNFNNSSDLQKLSLKDIVKIDKQLRRKYQKRLVQILKKEIYHKIKILMPKTKIDFRVGVQAKYKFDRNFIKKHAMMKLDSKKYFMESNNFPNCCFPTRAHQDLSNNGFRSTSVLIFFIQLSKYTRQASMLEIAEFKGKPMLEELNVKSNYGNEVKKRVVKTKKWIIPKSLKPGKITIMDSLTLHKSKENCVLPRLALNIKIQPTNLLYVYKCFGIKKNFQNLKTRNQKLIKLSSDLKKVVQINHGLNFELSVLHFILGDLKQSKIFMQKLFKKKIKKNYFDKYIAGAIYRKTINQVQKEDLKKIYKLPLKVEKNSCADSILCTIQ